YFKRVEAVEFTIKQDDGALVKNLKRADVVLLGVSRSSKTPLSMYLAQQFGYKVANVPLVLGIPVPEEIFDVDPRRVFCLIIQPQTLKRIRTRRLAVFPPAIVPFNCLGCSAGTAIHRGEDQYISDELRWARELYAKHPEWSVIDVTVRTTHGFCKQPTSECAL
ncbi:bifunctional kinase-pyrophosphorylase, partial [Baffinella frigidus]